MVARALTHTKTHRYKRTHQWWKSSWESSREGEWKEERMKMKNVLIYSKSSSSPKRLSIFAFPSARCTSICCMTSREMAFSGARRRSSLEKRWGDTGYMVLVRFSRDWRICSWKISTFFLEAGLRPLASEGTYHREGKKWNQQVSTVTQNVYTLLCYATVLYGTRYGYGVWPTGLP